MYVYAAFNKYVYSLQNLYYTYRVRRDNNYVEGIICE